MNDLSKCPSEADSRILHCEAGAVAMTYVVLAVLLVAAAVAAVIVFSGALSGGTETAGHAVGGQLSAAGESAVAARENHEAASVRAMSAMTAIQGGELALSKDSGFGDGGNADVSSIRSANGHEQEPFDPPMRILFGDDEPPYSAWKSFWEGFIVGENYELYGDDFYRYQCGWIVAGQFVNTVSIGAIQKLEYGLIWAAKNLDNEEEKSYGLEKAKEGAIELALQYALKGIGEYTAKAGVSASKLPSDKVKEVVKAAGEAYESIGPVLVKIMSEKIEKVKDGSSGDKTHQSVNPSSSVNNI